MNDKFTIAVSREPESNGWLADLMDASGASISTHARTSVAAAIMAVTIELHDLVDPYKD